MRLQLLDLDGSVAAQTSLPDAAPWTAVERVDLRDLGPSLRLWSRADTIRRVRERLPAPAGPTVHLLGSGDFHHLAALLMERAGEPITVVHLDNHPDWVRLAPRWHCGAWVNRALALPPVRRVITLGPCSADLEKPGLKGGNIPALAAGRLLLFPWQHAPSRLYRPIRDGASYRYADGHLVWDNLGDGDFDAHLARILPLIDTEAIWISIDKDVLPEREAITNWDQGQMPLAAVIRTIETLGGARRIVGADICGEYSPPRHANVFKRWEAKLDQPARAVDATHIARNEQVNRELLAAIEKAARRC